MAAHFSIGILAHFSISIYSVMPINIALCIISSVMQRGIAFVWIVGIHGGIRKIRKTVNVLIAV